VGEERDGKRKRKDEIEVEEGKEETVVLKPNPLDVRCRRYLGRQNCR
jgi:hypothetical protein